MVVSEELGLRLGDLRECPFQRCGGPGVQLPTAAHKQAFVGDVTDEGVLEDIPGMGWPALAEQQLRPDERV
jgi:hypothetical protein